MENRSQPKRPLCVDLRSKKLQLSSRAAFEEADVLDASNHCWCARTFQVLGPDRDVAHPEACTETRVCYRQTRA